MLFCVRVCLIWILYGYNWRWFFNVLWADKPERPTSWERLQSDFSDSKQQNLALRRLSGDRAVNFLPLVDNCPFLVDLINVPVSLNFSTQRVIWNSCGKLLKLKLLRYLACTVFKHFVSRIEGYAKCFFFPLCMSSSWMILECYSIIYQPWKIHSNISNIGGAINRQVSHVYTETTCTNLWR